MNKNEVSSLKFYWTCVKDAFRGTVERANAWAWGIGAGLLWFILAALKQTQTEGPSTIGGSVSLEIAFGVISIVLTWGVIFVFRLIGAPTRLYNLARRDNEKLTNLIGTLEESLRPKIELVFDEDLEKCKNLENVGIFVHVLAFNRSAFPIEDCEAFLISLEIADKDGTFRSVGFKSRKNLAWARPPDGDPNKSGKICVVDGPEPELIDVFHALPRPPDSHASNLLHLKVQSFEPGWTIKHGTYRLGLQVSAKNNVSAHIVLFVDWRGNCQELRVWRG